MAGGAHHLVDQPWGPSGFRALLVSALVQDELRFIGNLGAHPTDDVVSPLDAREALDFLVAIVETIYVFRPKFQAMKARRARAQQPEQKPDT